ncbi:MAG: protease, partial [Planctomycetota bacterium]
MNSRILPCWVLLFVACSCVSVRGDDKRLLRQPTISDTQVAFTYGSDLWTVDREGGRAVRITSTSAVEQSPHFSPDGKWIAFTSNRSGVDAVYVVAAEGGSPTRLTWYPAGSIARGWTPDGEHVLYSSSRETAPTSFHRLWTVPLQGGPSTRLPAHWGFDGSFSASGKRIVVDRVSRWDTEWRHYRGGQNTPLTILNLDTLSETRIANERTTDIQPLWLGEKIYFLSDRDWVMNIWSYDPSSEQLEQLTEFTGADIKWLNGVDQTLVYERNGFLSKLDLENKETARIKIDVVGDFPWAEKRWLSVDDSISSASLSTTGKRALFEARGEVFTVPVENGSPRNLTQSSGGADRSPMWSPKGDKVAWFSDDGSGYKVLIANQDGAGEVDELEIGDSKFAWEATWSPDGSHIAFVDNDVQVRLLEIETGEIRTVGSGGVNIERGSMGLTWSPDSKWLAYSKTFPNNLRRIMAWSMKQDKTLTLTDSMADSMSPTWDRDGKHLYFLASTDVALASGWANTSTMAADPRYGAYVMLLNDDTESPFKPESDEEEAKDA